MTSTNPFEAMMTMGQDWAKQLNPALESFAPKGFEEMLPTMSKDMMEQFMGIDDTDRARGHPNPEEQQDLFPPGVVPLLAHLGGGVSWVV